MAKQFIHIYIDSVTYLKLKASGENMSELGNRLFSQYFELEDQEIPEETELVEQISKLHKVIKDAQDQMSQYTIMLSKIRKEREEQEKMQEAQKEAMFKAIQRSDSNLDW